ncbi:MAG: hypothetical protein KDA44_06300 [Planctomycetales bacterium]|nr:hypothetical protein [Planctomycetales bacterium]
MSARFASSSGRLFVALGLLALCCSCWFDSKSTPKPLAPKAMLNVYQVSPAKTAMTTTAKLLDTGATVYLIEPPVIAAADVATVSRVTDSLGQPAFGVQLNPAGAAKMSKATAAAIGQRFAFVVNGVVLYAPKVNSPITSEMVIEGNMTVQQRDDIFTALTGE